jgi:ankyrin repeat protein
MDPLKESLQKLLSCGDIAKIRYHLISRFRNVEDFAAFLKEHPETRQLYIDANTTPGHVQCYLHFILQQNDNAEDLYNIALYAFDKADIFLLSSFPADYVFVNDERLEQGIERSVVHFGRCDIFDFLLARNVFRDPRLMAYILYRACVSKKLDVVSRLLQAGADPNFYQGKNKSIFYSALRHATASILHYLVVHGVDIHRYSEESWMQAAKRADVSIMEFLHDMRLPLPEDIIRDILVDRTQDYQNGGRMEQETLINLRTLFTTLRSYGAKNPTPLEKIYLIPEDVRFLGLD